MSSPLGRDCRGRGAAGDGIGNGRAALILVGGAGNKVLVVDRDLAMAERTVTMIATNGAPRPSMPPI